AARDAYVAGVDRLLSADANIEDAFRTAIAADEGFALAHIALARTFQVLGRGAEVKAPLARALALAAVTSEREQSEIAILAKVLTGQGAAAIPLILEHAKTWPRDAMVLSPRSNSMTSTTACATSRWRCEAIRAMPTPPTFAPISITSLANARKA